MKTFPSDAKFKYTWRHYQKSVLDQLDTFLENNHLHIVAPPGSGKTVLGLEAMLRLNKPTLILAPTLTIRDQWINRLCDLFLHIEKTPSWISTDIRNPEFLTIITYQGLHSACGTLYDVNKIAEKLKDKKVEVFILDEAHHLKNQWWLTLNRVKQSISPTIIGLTATPPYDSTYVEWKRYLEMNGEIDTEISVPELIREGDLCPHQDYVYFLKPTVAEFEKIETYRKNISIVFNNLCRSEVLVSSFIDSEVWTDPESHLEWIYENLKVYTSYLLLLIHNNVEIPDVHLEVLGLNEKDRDLPIPELSYERLEVILNFFLFEDKKLFTDLDAQKEEILHKLRAKGAVERNVVKLCHNSKIDNLLVTSNGKLNSIVDIVKFEYSNLRNKLRMVILSDFIREEYLYPSDFKSSTAKKMGVVPIFEILLESNLLTDKIGVLTGSLVILPRSSLTKFQSLCEERNILFSEDLYTEYKNKYIIVSNSSSIKEFIVEITTQLFSEGDIEILVGTKSLLGEGWDAPAINALILATFVGSFVLSNQMRGRAIRVQRDNSSKTSNIWHLVCIDTTAPQGGQDLEILSRRFKSFVGISNTDDPYIENGLDRLNIKKDHYSDQDIVELNASTFYISMNRERLKGNWAKAIEGGVSIVDEIKIPYSSNNPPREQTMNMYYNKTIAFMIAELCMLLLVFGYEVLGLFVENLDEVENLKDAYYFVIATAIIGMIVFGKQIFKAIKIYTMYRDIAKDFENIAKTLLKSFLKEGIITTPEEKLVIKSETLKDGTIFCCLKGATRGEQAIFMNSFKEILSVIDNPRYLITRKGDWWKIKKNDYHSVPELIGVNKKSARLFHQTWNSIVGNAELIYTRTLDGRKMLLKARMNSLSSKLDDEEKPQEYRKWI